MKTMSLSQPSYTTPAPETTAGLRRVALLASGVAAMVALAATAIVFRFAMFGIGHQSFANAERIRALVGF